MKPRAQRQAWWASLSPAERDAYIQRRAARKARQPNTTALEAMARVDLANELGVFMAEVPDADVQARIRQMRTAGTDTPQGRNPPMTAVYAVRTAGPQPHPITGTLTGEQAQAIRSAHYALHARGRGKDGIHTTTVACRVIRELLTILGDLTGITSATDVLAFEEAP